MRRRLVLRGGLVSGSALTVAALMTLATALLVLAAVVQLTDSPSPMTVPAGTEIDVTLPGNHVTPDGFFYGVGLFSSTDPTVVNLVSQHHGADSNTAVFEALKSGLAHIQAIAGVSGVVCSTPSPAPVVSASPGAPTPSPVPSPIPRCIVADPRLYDVAVTVTPALPRAGRPQATLVPARLVGIALAAFVIVTAIPGAVVLRLRHKVGSP